MMMRCTVHLPPQPPLPPLPSLPSLPSPESKKSCRQASTYSTQTPAAETVLCSRTASAHCQYVLLTLAALLWLRRHYYCVYFLHLLLVELDYLAN